MSNEQPGSHVSNIDLDAKYDLEGVSLTGKTISHTGSLELEMSFDTKKDLKEKFIKISGTFEVERGEITMRIKYEMRTLVNNITSDDHHNVPDGVVAMYGVGHNAEFMTRMSWSCVDGRDEAFLSLAETFYEKHLENIEQGNDINIDDLTGSMAKEGKILEYDDDHDCANCDSVAHCVEMGASDGVRKVKSRELVRSMKRNPTDVKELAEDLFKRVTNEIILDDNTPDSDTAEEEEEEE